MDSHFGPSLCVKSTLVFSGFQLEAVPSISIDDVGFYLFTPKNPTEGQKLKINDTDLLDDSNFNFNWPIR